MNRNFQPVIKWSGSKRSQAFAIVENIPHFDRYYEPFIGGGSVVFALSPKNGICGDICEPLINLWHEIQNDPINLYEQYKIRWDKLQSEGHQVFYEIRNNFNKNQNPNDFLFLSRTCVNGLIRFNRKGGV